MSWNLQVLVKDAFNSASRGVHFDREGRLDVAAYFYREAARLLETACREDSSCNEWLAKAKEYNERATALDNLRISKHVAEVQSNSQKLLGQAHFLFSQALDADESGNEEEAVEFYKEAVELSLNATKSVQEPDLHKKLTDLAKQALERAEELKGISNQEAPPPLQQPNLSTISEAGSLNIKASCVAGVQASTQPRPKLHRGHSAHLVVSGQEAYTDEEKRVLLLTSRINSVECVPFMSVDLRERFQYSIQFTDRDGLLALSPKQKRSFARWARPEEFCSEPKMIELIDCFSIKQTVVSDCSFVASLAVSALFEKRFKKSLVTSIIYPRNSRGQPIYNPFGKYMVKLHLNGVPRKVIIDDQLPLGHHGELLCSYSTNKNELWISLLEKAYMKVMGGYDFPGSNSNIDLHALTGWIPERVSIATDQPDFNKDNLFNKLLQRLPKGDVLVTVATGELSDAESERTGLVSTHAYAVLDVREVKGVKLMLVKNPWSHLRWKGNYSELDALHWTDEMKKLLSYDPNSAAMFDNGVFWIDYDSICKFFDVFYLNWNPSLFNYTYCIHQSWKAGSGPIKDAYNIGDNPQYSLEVQSPGGSAVWVLLTRHITQIEDFKENREYITVLVYKNNGKRVYYPYDPPPYIDGVRINSPHYLCKILLQDKGVHRFTLVVSQYEKMNTIFYTLRAYSTCSFSLKKIGHPHEHKQQISNGEWKGRTAGGCGNNPSTYPNNPRYQVKLESTHNNNFLLIDLKGPKQYQIGFDIVCVIASDSSAPGYFKQKSSGSFRSGFVVLDLENVPAGTYDIIPSTFYPGQEGPFFLTVQASCPLKVARLQ